MTYHRCCSPHVSPTPKINSDINARVLQSSPFIYDDAYFNLNSYIGHRFEAKEIPSTKTGKYKNGAEGPTNPKLCGVAFFTVNSNFDQVFYTARAGTFESSTRRRNMPCT